MSYYLSQLPPDAMLCVKQTYYDWFDVMTKAELMVDQRYMDYLLGNDTLEVYAAEKIYPQNFDLYQALDFLCADGMPEDWLDEIYGTIANIIDIDGIESKINKVLQNAYAWDCGEVVIID